METITLNGKTYVEKINVSKVCVVRCRNAGVHVGEVLSRDAHTLVLVNSRRIWRWKGANCLSQFANEGCDVNSNDTKISPLLTQELTLTTSDVCEVIPMTETAANKIMGAKEWKF